MTSTAMIRCEKNENRCPLTGCITALSGAKQGFPVHEECNLAGIFTCRCPGDNVGDLAKIIK